MFERYIQDGRDPKYLSGKKKEKKERVLPKAGSYSVKDLEQLKKKVPMYRGEAKWPNLMDIKKKLLMMN